MRQYARNHNLKLILQHFAVMWVLTVVGVVFGMWLPSTIVIPLSFICMMLLFVAFFMRGVRLSNFILYLIPPLMGVMLFWITQFFIEWIGEDLVLTVFICTIIIFIGLAGIGLKLERDISDWASVLFAALFVLIVFSIVFIFFPVSNTFLLVLAGLFVLVFAVYTVFDFNMIRHNHVKDSDVVWMALNLYLNFINLFTNLLEVVARYRQ
ncbi:membrane protein [Lysinibacillus sp. PLM2]|nr:membrane protein [Lysinibacillus sp. PLM2]